MPSARRTRTGSTIRPVSLCLSIFLFLGLGALSAAASAPPLFSNSEVQVLQELSTEDNDITITDGLPFPFMASRSVDSEYSLLSLAEEVQGLSEKRNNDLPGEVCLLLHGTGSRGPFPPGSQADFWVRQSADSFQKSDLKQADKLRAYWGDLPLFLHQFKACREVVVRSIESIMRTWDNDTLITDYCSALNLEPKPTVVFTHSLANVVIGAGVGWQFPGCNRFVKRDDVAGLRAGGAVWFGVQGPLKGTAASNMCLGICKGRFDNITHLIEKFKINMARKNCGCGRDILFPKKPFPATRSCAPLYKSQVVHNGLMIQLRKTRNDGTELHKVPDGVKLKLQSEIAHEFMWGNLCGVTGSSIVWRPFHLHNYLDILSNFVQKFEGSKKGWGVDSKTVIDTKKNRFHGNDGFISFRSCSALDRKLFRADSSSAFYVLNGNHADGTGRIIDNYEYKDRQPRVWYLLRARSIKNVRAYGSVDPPNAKKHEKVHVDVSAADKKKKGKHAPPPTPPPPPPHPPAPVSPPTRGRRASREKPDAVLKSNAKDKHPAVQRGKSTNPAKKPLSVQKPPVRSTSLPTVSSSASARLAAKRRRKSMHKRRKATRRRRNRNRARKRSKKLKRSKRTRVRRSRFAHRSLQSSLSAMSREARARMQREVEKEQLEDLLSFDDEDDE